MGAPLPLILLGQAPIAHGLREWILGRVMDVVNDPSLVPHRLSRLGDLIVWKGESGSTVVAALETLGESQQRIESAVSGIESAQIAMSSTIATVQALSLATFGVSALSAGFMVWRLHALNQRLDRLGRQVADIEARLDARDRALLDSSLQFLREYEQKDRASDLEQALSKSRDSATTYGHLVGEESEGGKRLPALNYYGRCYLLSLLTELRCMALRGDNAEAVERAEKEQPRLRLLVTTTYQRTLANAPEVFLHPNMASSGVTLELMTELYQQLQHADALTEIDIRDACGLFEHLRQRIFDTRSRFWSPSHRAKADCLNRLRYLISCVEDCNRIRSLSMLIQHAGSSKLSLRELSEQVQELRRDSGGSSGKEPAVFAYRFA